MPTTSTLLTGPAIGQGIASGLDHRLQYIARFTNNAFGPNGNSWLVTTMPYMSFGTVIVDDMSREVFMVESQRGTTRWIWDSGTSQYVGQYGTKRRVTLTANGYLVTASNGASWLFFGPESLAGLRGKLKQMIASDGIDTHVSYDGNQRLTSLERNLAGTQHSASLHYTSAISGPHEGRYLMVEKRISRDGVVQPVKRWNYTYHSGTDSAGNLNDLKTASESTFNIQTHTWEELYTTYYRYYTENSSSGFKHGLRFTLNPQDYAIMQSSGYPPENISMSPDNILATFASTYREYDSQKRITLWQARGGTLTTTFEHVNSEGSGQNWSRRTIKSMSDGSVQTTYYNQTNQPLLKILTDVGVTTMEYSEYDNQYNLLTRCGTDAILGIEEPVTPSQNLLVVLHNDKGLLKKWQYYPENAGVGSAAGYVKWEGIQKGGIGSIIKLYELTYSAHTVNNEIIYRVATRSDYRSDAGGGSSPSITGFSYEWHPSSGLPSQVTTTPPSIPTDENGTGEIYSQTDLYDRFGNIEWRKDEVGMLTFQVFDPITGGLWQRIVDVDVQRMNPGVVPYGWISPVEGGRHLISDYDCDIQGRNIQELGPLHSCDIDGSVKIVRKATFNVYLDSKRQNWSSDGYAIGDGYRTLGPVTIIKRNLQNLVTDIIQSVNPGGDKIDGGDRFPQSNWTKWTRHVYSDGSLLLATCAYHTIPLSDREVDQNPVLGFKNDHYLETGYGYDSQDRRNKVVSPGGTITYDVLNARGLVTERWVGTNDSGASNLYPKTENSSSDNNMVRVLVNTYDEGNLDSRGNLIEERRPFSEMNEDDQVIVHSYDFRGRRVLSTMSDGINVLIQSPTYDNVGNVISETSYHTAVNDANRTAYNTTSYDALSRPYLYQLYGVNQDSGALTFPLKNISWYNPVGLVIKTVSPGFKGFIKSRFDSLRRLIATFRSFNEAEELGGNDSHVSDDIVIEQTEYSYDDANNLLNTTVRQRLHNAIGTGSLNNSGGLQPRARVTYLAQWYDPTGREKVLADYGTNGGKELSRPLIAPQSSDTILVTLTDYAKDGQAAQTISADGVIVRLKKDSLGRQIERIDNFVADSTETNCSDNRTTQFAYSPDGGLNSLIVKNIVTGDQITKWEYGTTLEDSGVARTDLLSAKIYPGDVASNGTLLQSISYRYDRQGRNIGNTDAKGTVHAFDLDKVGRILEDRIVTLGTAIDSEVRRISYSFDPRGSVKSITSHNDPDVGVGGVVNQVINECDAFGQLTADIQSHEGNVESSTPGVRYVYAGGSTNTIRCTSVIYPSGKILNINYGEIGSIDDRLDRVAQLHISGESQALATFTWAGHERFLCMSLPLPQIELTYIKQIDDVLGDSGDLYTGYDRFGRTVNMRWNKIGDTETTTLAHIQYGYDRANRKIWRQDLALPASAAQDKFYAYDRLGQIVKVDQGNININRTAVSSIPASTESFSYDPIGNWTYYQRDEDGFPILEQARRNNLDNQIQLIDGVNSSISYDASGNMTATRPDKTGDWSKGYTMVWDAWNRLVKVMDRQGLNEIASYEYDGSNRRTVTQSLGVNRHFYYNHLWKCIEERLDENTTPDSVYYWSLRPNHRDELLRRDKEGASLWCIMDYFDPIAIANNSGEIQERYFYSAFGLARIYGHDLISRISSLFAWNFLFHGQFRDTESGLYNYGFRYYQPQIGRWLGRDSIREQGGINLYAFANNSAMNSVDYLGLSPDSPDCCKTEENLWKASIDAVNQMEKLAEDWRKKVTAQGKVVTTMTITAASAIAAATSACTPPFNFIRCATATAAAAAASASVKAELGIFTDYVNALEGYTNQLTRLMELEKQDSNNYLNCISQIL